MIAKIIILVWTPVCIWLVIESFPFARMSIPLRETNPLIYVVSFAVWWLVGGVPALLIAAMFKRDEGR